RDLILSPGGPSMFSFPIVLALVASGPTEAQAREAVESSIAFLQEDAVDWSRVMRCASCHHAPMAVWAIQEAKSRGYAVDDAALAELVKVAVDDPVSSGLLPREAVPDPFALSSLLRVPAEREAARGRFAFSATYGLLASRALSDPSPA